MVELSATSQRVLGALVEKAMATPDGYPLSANALRTACNQKTARDPVMALTEDEVTDGIAELREHGLILTKYQPGSRVPKYAHLLHEKLDLRDGHVAIVGVLLLRGPQTVGEVKGRTGRMHDFADIEEVERLLAGLTDHKFHGALVEPLPRQPGQKEERWRHLFGPVQTATEPTLANPTEVDDLRSRVELLEAENVRLRSELNEARRQLDELTAPGASV